MRPKRGVTSRARHNKIKKATKGMTLSARSSVRRGKQAVVRSLENAYNDRRNKKRTFRQLWNTRINAAARENGTNYSLLMNGMKQKNIMKWVRSAKTQEKIEKLLYVMEYGLRKTESEFVKSI